MKTAGNCDAQVLVRYLDEDLDLPERREVDAHLDGCQACRRELAQLRGVLAAADLSAPSPPSLDSLGPDAMVHRVRRAVRERPERSWRGTWPTALASGVVSAAALLVVLIGTDRLSLPGTGLEAGVSPAAVAAVSDVVQSADAGQPEAVYLESAGAGDFEDDFSWEEAQSEEAFAANIDEFLMSTASEAELLAEMEALALEEELLALLVEY